MATNKSTKYIFITGGVLSSLGKGLAAASIGAIMEARGLKVCNIKLDPYINVDPGTMSPFQHGEVFVTDDGAETDLDLGHYERFTSSILCAKNNFTTGQIYDSVIQKERNGEYLGKTVQVIPHITDEIKVRIRNAAVGYDIAIVEVGGTVGDIESLPFLEAIRQFGFDMGKANVLYIHLTLVPYIAAAGELKSKPTQHSVQKLREIGIQPLILLCRSEKRLTTELKEKIALFCNVEKSAVINAVDVESIYQVPIEFHREGLDDRIIEYLNMWTREPRMQGWEELNEGIRNRTEKVNIAVVGKYVKLTDSYKSLNEALEHGGIFNRVQVNRIFVDADELVGKDDLSPFFENIDGILIPGGFGERGTEGKILAAGHARKNRIPFFGICLGMQLAVTEFARNVCSLKAANSTEFDPATPEPVIDFLPGQKSITRKGGTMRLGAYSCTVEPGTLAMKAYGSGQVSERHRHRYEFNPAFEKTLTDAGLIISGRNPESGLVEIVELPENPWFLGCQFHPEFKSKPMQVHPLFRDFIKAGLEYRRKR
ncbi:MAG: CTP synthase [Desulfobacterota bacterium]|jgi:CTP synthase|nr:CTP synthase [Thermodesulfobacteriota bacterium]